MKTDESEIYLLSYDLRGQPSRENVFPVREISKARDKISQVDARQLAAVHPSDNNFLNTTYATIESMAGRSDLAYPQLVKALNLLTESKAKIEFLVSKIDSRLTDLEDEELSQVAQRSIAEPLNGANQINKWRLTKDKADSLQRSLFACKEKCDALQGRVQRLIEVKDTLLCQSIFHETPPSNEELLPGGTRTERMKLELSSEVCECSICSETVKRTDSIWSCRSCYNVFHLSCIRLCIDASGNNGKWNCPICRLSMDVVRSGLIYTCFCGRVTSPKSSPGVTPHSCGQKCQKGCRESCHPGPCSSTA